MRYYFLISFACLLFLSREANAQLTPRYDPSGGPHSISRPNPMTDPAIRDPGLRHIGAVEQWSELAPRKNVVPSVTRVLGNDLHLALFNYRQDGGKLESSLAFQFRPFIDKQVVKVEVFAVEQNGQPVVRTPLTASQAIQLKKQGAVLPFTVEMQEGESLVCEVVFTVNEAERGKTKIKVSRKGLDFAVEEKPQKPKPD